MRCVQRACFSQAMFTKEQNSLKKVEMVFQIKIGQLIPLWKAYMRLWIQLMHSFGLTEVLQSRTFLDSLEFLLQHTKLYMMILHFLSSFVVRFLQANARRYTAARTLETISRFVWEQLTYSLYSPDQLFHNFHLFGPLKSVKHSFHATIKWRTSSKNT